MFIIEKTDEFDKWFRKLKDLKAKSKILFRLQKIQMDGHFGEYKTICDGIRELKIDYANGFRIYFKELNGKIIIILCGGDKSTQQKDILKATEILKRIKIHKNGNFKI
ncbi:MAG: type II toxin-antitoxin system RelE/ParE family toxin [Saprospiraceae bacterium]|mgnify:CR=1 FL=1|jgi:putative addiction module killer protein